MPWLLSPGSLVYMCICVYVYMCVICIECIGVVSVVMCVYAVYMQHVCIWCIIVSIIVCCMLYAVCVYTYLDRSSIAPLYGMAYGI
jgi:hypothetical protein